MSNAYGNDNRGIRRFLREHGIAPTVSNVERIGREVRRSEAENERVVRDHKAMERERGLPSTVDSRGRDAKEVARRKVRRELDARPVPKSRRDR